MFRKPFTKFDTRSPTDVKLFSHGCCCCFDTDDMVVVGSAVAVVVANADAAFATSIDGLFSSPLLNSGAHAFLVPSRRSSPDFFERLKKIDIVISC